ncbi:hypothetical protein [Superficieibacter electus]|nr:hypothetical protein [Superficieibacter electus]
MSHCKRKKWLILTLVTLLFLLWVSLVDETLRDEIRVFLRQLAQVL